MRFTQIIADDSNRRCSELSKKITEKYAEAVGSTDFEIHISSEVNIIHNDVKVVLNQEGRYFGRWIIRV